MLFSNQPDANAHVAQHGGFVYEKPDNLSIYNISVDWNAQTATALSQAEIDANNAAVADAIIDNMASRDLERNVGKVMFRIVNEIRLLQGKPELTPAQFKTWYKQQIAP